ncbi:hypothetical protein NPIL_191481 [Nephila pilipes]|uniref:Uncharacterized protein n=1 Tax=Nephila pilipes TaxID=299642 RepID=A0A8X6QZU5_NEPPI|nr:hypothetical protein NPIL_191481 [Nephila pilipes]
MLLRFADYSLVEIIHWLSIGSHVQNCRPAEAKIYRDTRLEQHSRLFRGCHGLDLFTMSPSSHPEHKRYKRNTFNLDLPHGTCQHSRLDFTMEVGDMLQRVVESVNPLYLSASGLCLRYRMLRRLTLMILSCLSSSLTCLLRVLVWMRPFPIC